MTGYTAINKVFVVSVGASTSIGYRAATTAASVKTGINRFAPHPFMVDSKGNGFITAHAQYLPSLMDVLERGWELGSGAAAEALGIVSSSIDPIGTIPLIIGFPHIRPGFTAKMAHEIQARFEKTNFSGVGFSSIDTICSGHAAGLMAIEKGFEIISQGRTSLCLAGGVDSWMSPDDMEWLDSLGMIHTTSNPWGCVPGEGAGFCLLASEKMAQKLDVSIEAEILSTATIFENNLINSDSVCTGEGLSQAIATVYQEAAFSDGVKIDQILSDLNGQRYRADELGFALVKTGRFFKEVGKFKSPADNWGDVGAASGPLFVSLAAQHATASGELNLLLTGADTGERSALLVKVTK